MCVTFGENLSPSSVLILSKLYILAPSNSQRNPSTLSFEVASVEEMLSLHATICQQVNQNDLTMFNKNLPIQQEVFTYIN
jgi:hypothetical protein